MVLSNTDSNSTEGSNATPEVGHISGQAQAPPWFGPARHRARGGPHHGFHGAPGHPGGFATHFHHPAIVSLEPGFGGPPGHPHPPPPPFPAFSWGGHAHHGAPHPPTPPEFPDPPIAPLPPHGAPEAPPAPFTPEFFDWMGNNIRNVAGEFVSAFAPPGPHRGPHHRGMWRGGRGRGGRHGHWHGPHGHHEHHHETIHPTMDIYSSEDSYIVTLELPGLKKEDVDISVSEGTLVISGEISTTPTDAMDEFVDLTDEDDEATIREPGNHKAGFVIRERAFGKFKRSITLPPWVNVDAITASMVDGLLKLVFEKPQTEMHGSTPRKVPIF